MVNQPDPLVPMQQAELLNHLAAFFVHSIFEAIIDIFGDLGLKRDQPRVLFPPPCTSKVLLKGWHFDPDAGPLKLVVKNRANATGGEDFAWDNEHRGRVLLCPVL